jgi:hypothetical protein
MTPRKPIDYIPLKPKTERQRRILERMIDLLNMGIEPGTVSKILCKRIINKEEI